MTSLEEISLLADVSVEIDVVLDRKVLSIAKILDLKLGSILKMNRSAGENIDILVGGALVGYGEIVIIEDAIGVRITDFNEESL